MKYFSLHNIEDDWEFVRLSTVFDKYYKNLLFPINAQT